MKRLIGLVAVLVALSLPMASADARPTIVPCGLKAILHGSPTHPHAQGIATSIPSGGRDNLGVRVSHIPGLSGRWLGIWVHGVWVGRTPVTARGTAHFSRTTLHLVGLRVRVAVRVAGGLVARGPFKSFCA